MSRYGGLILKDGFRINPTSCCALNPRRTERWHILSEKTDILIFEGTLKRDWLEDATISKFYQNLFIKIDNFFFVEVYLQQDKKKAKAESKNCHAFSFL